MDPAYQAVLALLPQPWAGYVATALVSYFAVCTIASAIDFSFPPPVAGSWLVGPRNLVHALALNKNYARNAVTAGAVPASIAEKVAEVRAVAHEVETAAGELMERATGNPEAARPPGGER